MLELPKGLFTAGYKAVLHVHSVTEECEIQALISQIDPKTRVEKKVCTAGLWKVSRPHASHHVVADKAGTAACDLFMKLLLFLAACTTCPWMLPSAFQCTSFWRVLMSVMAL